MNERDALLIVKRILLDSVPDTLKSIAGNQFDKNRLIILNALKKNKKQLIKALKGL